MKPEQDYTVGDFMTKDLVQVSQETTVKQCAEVMVAERVSSAVVLENNAVTGIITEKDLAKKVVAKGLDANKLLVKDVMSVDLVTVEPETSLYDAMLKLTKNKIKHLPVVRDNVALGIITAMDILRVQPSYMEVLSAAKDASEQQG